MDVSKLVERGAIAANGVWADIGDGAQVFICSAANIEFIRKREALERQLRKSRGMRPEKDLPIDEGFALTKKASFNTVLKGWRGITYDGEALAVVAQAHSGIVPPPNPPTNGSNDLPFTEANVAWLFEADPHFWRIVSDLSGDAATFERENLEVVGKA